MILFLMSGYLILIIQHSAYSFHSFAAEFLTHTQHLYKTPRNTLLHIFNSFMQRLKQHGQHELFQTAGSSTTPPTAQLSPYDRPVRCSPPYNLNLPC